MHNIVGDKKGKMGIQIEEMNFAVNLAHSFGQTQDKTRQTEKIISHNRTLNHH